MPDGEERGVDGAPRSSRAPAPSGRGAGWWASQENPHPMISAGAPSGTPSRPSGKHCRPLAHGRLRAPSGAGPDRIRSARALNP